MEIVRGMMEYRFGVGTFLLILFLSVVSIPSLCAQTAGTGALRGTVGRFMQELKSSN